MNSHLSRPDNIYSTRFREYKKLLLESGIRHVRDEVPLNPAALQKFQDLEAQGVRLCLLLFKHRGASASVADYLAVIRQNLAPGMDYIEGHNEPDGSFPRTGAKPPTEPGTWGPGVRAWSQEIWRGVNADATLKIIPVIGSALSHAAEVDSRTPLGDCTGFVTLGNLHAYPGGRPPEATILNYLAWGRPNYGDLKCPITETGYHTALDNPPNKHKPASEAVQAIYAPRLLFEHFRLGVPRSYFYQFLDDRTDEDCRRHGQPVQEAHFGFVDYELHPKPAYYAVKNLLTLLHEAPGGDFKPATLGYDVTGPKDQLRHVLLQKRNGTFSLAIWRAVNIWDEKELHDISVPAVPVTVKLDAPAHSIKCYSPTVSSAPIPIDVNVGTINLEIESQMLILEITN